MVLEKRTCLHYKHTQLLSTRILYELFIRKYKEGKFLYYLSGSCKLSSYQLITLEMPIISKGRKFAGRKITCQLVAHCNGCKCPLQAVLCTLHSIYCHFVPTVLKKIKFIKKKINKYNEAATQC